MRADTGTAAPDTVAGHLRPLVEGLLRGPSPVPIRFWDGSALGPPSGEATLVVHSADALRRLLFAPNELGLGRAYVAGDIDVEGDIYAALSLRDAVAGRDEHADLRLGPRGLLDAVTAARRLGAIGRPPPPPPEEASVRGRLHSVRRDRQAVRHHYDVSNDFFRLVLGDTMTYSCGYWFDEARDLDDAQRAKHEHVCRKLALRPGIRLLDVGCGWGEMAIHAARHHGAEVLGVTVSEAQAELARKRTGEAGVADRVEIRVQDYREVGDGPFDAISSIGMVEHVGREQLTTYLGTLHRLLRPGGRLLNHGISRPPGPGGHDRTSFIERYVFPDGELHEVGHMVSAIQEAGFEVRDVESLREHYALTLRQWVANLEANWDEAVRLAGRARARIWRLYMAGSAINFEEGRTSIHQVLAVRHAADGTSGMPRTRRDWYAQPVSAAV